MVTNALGELVVRFAGGGGKSPLMGGDPSNSMGGSRGDNAQKEQVGVLQKIRDSAKGQAEGMKNQPRWWTKALKTMGIQMGIAGILKQSQIFTSTLGSLFQILGAFVDVMLAPWMPVIVPGLRKLANQIPNMRVAAQKFFDYVMALPWGTLRTLGKWLVNAMNPMWWSNLIETGIGKIDDWISGLWSTASEWVRTFYNNTFAKLPWLDEWHPTLKDNTKAIHTEGAEGRTVMEKISLGIGGLAATWTAAKLARYGLQATRWIPFVNKFTEPVRLIGKGIDRLFNKTAQILGKGFANLTKGLFNQLKGLFPKKPIVPGAPKGRPLVDADDAWKPKKARPGRPTGRGGYRGPIDADDAWKPKGKGGGRGVDIDRYRKNYDAIDWGEGKGKASAGSFADEAGMGGGEKPGRTSKIGKATKAMTKFKDWLGKSVP